MNARIQRLTQSLTLIRNPGAAEAAIRDLVANLRVSLPDEYLEFLRIANGAEGYISRCNYLRLYSSCYVLESYSTYSEWVPWLVFFGTSGSISGYGFDTRSRVMPVLEVDWIGLDSNPVYLCGMSFVEFLENLSQDVEPRELGPHPPPP